MRRNILSMNAFPSSRCIMYREVIIYLFALLFLFFCRSRMTTTPIFTRPKLVSPGIVRDTRRFCCKWQIHIVVLQIMLACKENTIEIIFPSGKNLFFFGNRIKSVHRGKKLERFCMCIDKIFNFISNYSTWCKYSCFSFLLNSFITSLLMMILSVPL